MDIIYLYISASKYGQHVHVDELTRTVSFSVMFSYLARKLLPLEVRYR